MSSVNSIPGFAAPLCQVKSGHRWTITNDAGKREITVKSRRELESPSGKGDTKLARNFEFIREVLGTLKKTTKEYSGEDVKALKALRKVVHEKYEGYCRAHCILWRILEVFIGLFTGYSHRVSYRRLIREIDNQLTAANNIGTQLNHVFKKWWSKGFSEKIKPGPVFLFVKVLILDKKNKLAKNNPTIILKKQCHLHEDTFVQDYRDFMKEASKDIQRVAVNHQENCRIVAEQISFSKETDEDGANLLSAVWCEDDGDVRESFSGAPILMYDGWAKSNLKHFDLPKGDILDEDGNFVELEDNSEEIIEQSTQATAEAIDEGKEIMRRKEERLAKDRHDTVTAE